MNKMKIYSLMGAISLLPFTIAPVMANVKSISCGNIKGSVITIGKGAKSAKIKNKTLNSKHNYIYFKFEDLDIRPGLDNVFHIRFATTFEQKHTSFHKVRLLRNTPDTVCHKEKKSEFPKEVRWYNKTPYPTRNAYDRYWQNDEVNNPNFFADLPKSWHFKYKSDDINNACVNTRETIERGQIEDSEPTSRLKSPSHKKFKYNDLKEELQVMSRNKTKGNPANAKTASYIWLRSNEQFYSSILIDAEAAEAKPACYKVSLKALLGRKIISQDLKPSETEFHVKNLPGRLDIPIVNYKRVNLKWK